MRLAHALLASVLCLSLCTAQAQDGSDVALVKALHQAESKNDAVLLYHLGMAYSLGLGAAKDHARARSYFERAADMGDALAAFKLGCYWCGQCGDGQPLDADKSHAYFMRAAQAGYMLAQSTVGLYFVKQQDWAQAKPWLERAGAQGYAQSLLILAKGYSDGRFGPPDNLASYVHLELGLARLPTEAPPAAREHLKSLAQRLSEADLQSARQQIANWREQKSALTLRALAGKSYALSLLDKPGQ